MGREAPPLITPKKECVSLAHAITADNSGLSGLRNGHGIGSAGKEGERWLGCSLPDYW